MFPSEGLPSPWDRDVDDTMSLLSVAFEHVPELDEERVAILGSSRGGAVALLAAVRDRRIDAGVEFFGPTDFFGEYAREISRRRSKASSAIFPVSSTSTRPSSGPVAHVPGSPRPWAVHPVPGGTCQPMGHVYGIREQCPVSRGTGHGRIDEDGLRERFGLRHTSDEAFGMSGPCFADRISAGNPDRRSRSTCSGVSIEMPLAVLGIVPAEERSTERLGLALIPEPSGKRGMVRSRF